MDNTAKGFANKIVNELERIVHRLDQLINAPREHNGKTIGSESSTGREHSHSHIHPLVTSESPPTPLHRENSNRCRYSPPPRWKTIVEVGALVAGIAYAIVTYFMWHDVRDNFKVDQRAWLGPGEAMPPPLSDGAKPVYVKEGSQIHFGVMLLNTGKTPAKKVRTQISMKSYPVNTRFEPVYERISPQPSLFVMHPNGRIVLKTFPSDEIATEESIRQLKNRDIVLYFYGKINYEDVFKEPHETIFCYFLLPDLGSTTPCGTYNDAN